MCATEGGRWKVRERESESERERGMWEKEREIVEIKTLGGGLDKG